MESYLHQKLREHCGHNVRISNYGEDNYTLECEDCNEVLFDTDLYDLCGIDEEE